MSLGRLLVDFGTTFGRFWLDFGLTLGRLGADFGPTLDWFWADSGLTLGRLGQGQLWPPSEFSRFRNFSLLVLSVPYHLHARGQILSQPISASSEKTINWCTKGRESIVLLETWST